RVPSNFDRDGGASYIERANQSVFVVAQIENREALEAIDDIVAIPGLDSVALGPMDLSASLGLMGQIEHPDVLAAIDHVIEAARKAGLWVGCGMGPNPDFAVKMARRGVHWLQVGGDYSYMIKSADQITSSIRSKLAAQ